MSQPEKKGTQESAKSTAAINKKSKGFTDEERAAMKERAKELKAEERADLIMPVRPRPPAVGEAAVGILVRTARRLDDAVQ